MYRKSFEAMGTGNVNLECTNTKWQNPNWTSDALYSTEFTECIPQDFTIKPTELMASSL